MSPTLGHAVCLGQLDPAVSAPGTTVTVRLPSGGDVTATVQEQLAFVDPAGERVRA